MAEPSAANPKIVTAVIAASGGAVVFVLTKLFEIVKAARDKRASERRLVNALYTEILHNKEELEESRDASPPVEYIRAKLGEKADRTIFATYSRNTRFFQDLGGELHVLPPAVLEATVRFYNTLESIYATMDGFERQSFKDMSLDGKVMMVVYMDEQVRQATIESDQALNMFEIHFPEFENRRRVKQAR